MKSHEARTVRFSRRLLAALLLLTAMISGISGFAIASATHRQTREFYLFPNELEFDPAVAGIPHYVFIPDNIVVNKGDTVTIHFYDTTDEAHTFTMEGPYATDHMLDAATATSIQHVDITFVAKIGGLFTYHCRFHPPTMTGTLEVQ